MEEKTPKIKKIEKQLPSLMSAPVEAGIEQFEMICKGIDYAWKQSEQYRLSIAKALSYIQNHKLYRYAGYKSFSAFVKERFHYGRTTFFNYVKVCRMFGICDPQTNDCMDIQPEYQKYSISQLIALSNLPKEVWGQARPEMSVREIQKLHRQPKPRTAGRKAEKETSRRTRVKKLKGVEISLEDLPKELWEPVTQAIRQINEQYPNAAIKGITASIQYELKGEDTHEET